MGEQMEQNPCFSSGLVFSMLNIKIYSSVALTLVRDLIFAFAPYVSMPAAFLLGCFF